MEEKHLSREQLTAFRDGALEDTRALEHLAGCSECQRAFDDSRWYLALARLRRDGLVGEHPGTDELAGYSTHALGHDRSQLVSLHLRSCDRCMARYRRLREAEDRLSYSTPRRALLRATQRRFRSRPKIRNLGVLLLRTIGESLLIDHVPDMTLRSVTAFQEAAASLPDPDLMLEEPMVEDEPKLHQLGIRRQQRLSSEAPSQAASEAGAPPPTFVVVEAGSLALIFDAGLREERPVISVLALDRSSGDPREGISVVIESGGGDRADAVTRPDRAVTLPLPRGDSTLLIRDRETYKLTLSF